MLIRRCGVPLVTIRRVTNARPAAAATGTAVVRRARFSRLRKISRTKRFGGARFFRLLADCQEKENVVRRYYHHYHYSRLRTCHAEAQRSSRLFKMLKVFTDTEKVWKDVSVIHRRPFRGKRISEISIALH